jgi:hypothetical protein
MPGHSPYTLSSLTILFAPDTHGLLRPIKFSKNWDDLLRKEVIQPHVPVRLPCYDFTPITNHNLGHGNHGLLLQRAFVV